MTPYELNRLDTNLQTLRAVRDNVLALASKGREGDPDATIEFDLRHAAATAGQVVNEVERIIRRNQPRKEE